MGQEQDQDEQTATVTLDEKPKVDQENVENLEQIDGQVLEQDDGQGQEEDDQKGETKAEEEDLGVEVVLESSDKAPEKETRKNFGKRIQKMNEKIDVAEQGEQKANDKLQKANDRIAQLEDQNKIQNLALDKNGQGSDPNGPPDPEKFDAGEYDPEYRKQLNAYQDARQDARMDQRFAKKVQEVEGTAKERQVQNARDYALEQKQEVHYDRALNMGVPKQDYYDTEDKVIAVLGKAAVNTIIKSIPNAHKILYYLGKNPKAVEEIADSLNADPVTGINDIAVMGAKITVKKITKHVRDPDKELEGGTPASSKKMRGPPGATFS
jgi:hypothetical protein